MARKSRRNGLGERRTTTRSAGQTLSALTQNGQLLYARGYLSIVQIGNVVLDEVHLLLVVGRDTGRRL